MTSTQEQIYQNRLAAEIVRYYGRRILKQCRAVNSTWNASIEWYPSASHGFFPASPVPSALVEFNNMVTAMRLLIPGQQVRCEVNASITPVADKTLYFPPIAAYPAPQYPPPLDTVPPTDKLPPVCTICGEKTYIA